MSSAFSQKEDKLEVQTVFEKREQEIVFMLAKELIKHHFADENGQDPQFHKFNKLMEIVKYWYNHKVLLIGESDVKYKKLLYFRNPKEIVDHIYRGINPHLNTTEHIRPVFNYYNKFSSTKYVNGNTIKEVFPTQKSHVNYVVMDSDWEAICAKVLEEIDEVVSYVKNQFLGFAIPYQKDGKDKMYFTDFIAKIKTKDGTIKHLMIEISGMSKEKAEKKWYVENRWLPAVNALKDKYNYPEWHFIEISNDIRPLKTLLLNKIQSL